MCELRPLPEYVHAITQQATEQFARPSGQVLGRRFARLFQHVDDPSWLLYVGEWESREAFEAYRTMASMPGRPEQYQRVPASRLYRRLTLFERVLGPVGIARAEIVDGPVESHAARRDLARDFHRLGPSNDASLVLLMLHESIEAPSGLLMVSGWDVEVPLTDPSLASRRELRRRAGLPRTRPGTLGR